MRTTLNAPLTEGEVRSIEQGLKALKSLVAEIELGDEPLTTAARIVDQAHDWRCLIEEKFGEANMRRRNPPRQRDLNILELIQKLSDEDRTEIINSLRGEK